MKILLVVIADLFIAVAAVFGAYEAFGAKRHATFTIPYTKKMVQKKILSREKGEKIIKEDAVSHYIGMALCVLVGVLMSLFIAKATGFITFVALAGGALIFLDPDMTETEATRSSYYNAHKEDMDVKRYHEYLVEVGDAGDDPILQG